MEHRIISAAMRSKAQHCAAMRSKRSDYARGSQHWTGGVESMRSRHRGRVAYECRDVKSRNT